MHRTKGMIENSQTLLLLDLLSFYISIFLSDALCGNAFFGAAVFIAGGSARSFFGLYAQRKEMDSYRTLISVVLVAAPIVLLASAVALLFVFSAGRENEKLAVTGIMALLVLRSFLAYEVVHWFADRRRLCVAVTVAIQISLSAAVAALVLLVAGHAYVLPFAAMLAVQPVALMIWLLRAGGKPLIEPLCIRPVEAASFCLYSSLRLSSEVSFYLSLMAYTGMFAILPFSRNMWLPVSLLIALLIGAALVMGRARRDGRFNRVERSSLVLIGGFLWLFARRQMNESAASPGGGLFWLWIVVQAMGLSIILLQVSQMQEDMKLVLELSGDGNDSVRDEQALRAHQFVLSNIAFLIAGTLISVEMYLLNLFVEQGILSGDSAPSQGMMLWVLSALPMAFVLLSMLFAVAQPLNRDIVRKLKLYHEQRADKAIIPELESKLRRLLVKRTRKRIGVKIIAFFLKPFCYHRILGAKNVSLNDGPVVFVANHREIYGPLILNLYLPFTFRPWIESRMLDPDEIREFLWCTIFSGMKPRWFATVAHRIVCSFAVWLLNSVEPIPVYRGTLREVVKTMELSVTAMQEQDNLLIFPENPEKSGGKYAQEGISPFFTGFVAVAKHYYKKTGKAAKFYPVYAQPKKRTLTIGQPVAYDPQGAGESERISDELMQAMIEMAR